MLDWEHAEPASDVAQPPELCVNLWWFFDVESELVQRLAGRVYALTGTDDDKLRILRTLAPTDFHTASQFVVPERFTVATDQGVLKGATGPTIIANHQSDVFHDVYIALEKELPDQIRFVDGEPSPYRLNMPQNVLNAITCIFEFADGRLVPQISKMPRRLQS